jgi:hypothetical protein
MVGYISSPLIQSSLTDRDSGIVTFPTAPSTTISAKGDIIYAEVVRENVRKLEQYVHGEFSPAY